MNSGLFGFWRRFGSVTGFFKPVPLPKPRQKPKILAAHRYIFSVNALMGSIRVARMVEGQMVGTRPAARRRRQHARGVCSPGIN
jgi:hypothetical protein